MPIIKEIDFNTGNIQVLNYSFNDIYDIKLKNFKNGGKYTILFKSLSGFIFNEISPFILPEDLVGETEKLDTITEFIDVIKCETFCTDNKLYIQNITYHNESNPIWLTIESWDASSYTEVYSLGVGLVIASMSNPNEHAVAKIRIKNAAKIPFMFRSEQEIEDNTSGWGGDPSQWDDDGDYNIKISYVNKDGNIVILDDTYIDYSTMYLTHQYDFTNEKHRWQLKYSMDNKSTYTEWIGDESIESYENNAQRFMERLHDFFNECIIKNSNKVRSDPGFNRFTIHFEVNIEVS